MFLIFTRIEGVRKCRCSNYEEWQVGVSAMVTTVKLYSVMT